MRIATFPPAVPAAQHTQLVVGVEPWQHEGLLRIHEELGVNEDAVVRAGLTLVLSLIGGHVTDVEGAPPPTDAISTIRRATREAALRRGRSA